MGNITQLAQEAASKIYFAVRRRTIHGTSFKADHIQRNDSVYLRLNPLHFEAHSTVVAFITG